MVMMIWFRMCGRVNGMQAHDLLRRHDAKIFDGEGPAPFWISCTTNVTKMNHSNFFFDVTRPGDFFPMPLYAPRASRFRNLYFPIHKLNHQDVFRPHQRGTRTVLAVRAFGPYISLESKKKTQTNAFGFLLEA
jgi:hypothetical protein